LPCLTRRQFLSVPVATLLWPPAGYAAPAAYPVRFRKASPYEAVFGKIAPGNDEFLEEKQASEIESLLNALPRTRSLPLANGFTGRSPMPVRLKQISQDVFEAEFAPNSFNFETGLRAWLNSLGTVRQCRFSVLPGERVRYEIASSNETRLEYRVGQWRQSWSNGQLSSFEPLGEVLTVASHFLFRDETSSFFGEAPSFQKQLLKGVPYWRSVLDSACGIDVYGSNGIAVGDIDGDGWDEIYVCQPAGLPNRLYKNRSGNMEDITEVAGLGVLDDTASALFVDFRNIGRQDLVIATIAGPLLFLNDGKTFRHLPEAFRFANPVQGSFTSMTAADFDRDGRVDIYMCTYIYFQSEDQYRYPVPYHDARNGPPNFLFRNELTQDGAGVFRDVTHAVGLDENNNRYSFAASWCDFDGNGWPDLYVANDFGRNNFYRNEGGHFRDIASQAGVEDVGPGMSAAWFDYDGDGRPDLYVSNMWSAAGQRVVADKSFIPAADSNLRDAYRRHTKGNSLYRNLGDGTFEDRSADQEAEMGRWAWSADGLDFDNDGRPEIYVGCGMLTGASETDLMSFFWRQVVARSPTTAAVAPAYENGWNAINQLIRQGYSWNGHEPNVLYARRGSRYYDFSGVSGADFADDTRAFAAVDLDGDGTLDLVLKSRLGPQVRALLNDWGTERRRIVFELRGTRSNRDAIGASVEVSHAGGRSMQYVRVGSGYLSQHTKRLHFGLGAFEVVSRVRIVWPSGTVQELANVRAGHCYRITEGSDVVAKTALLQRPTIPGTPPIPTPENKPRFVPTWLLEPLPLPVQYAGPGFLCLSADGKIAVPADVPFRVLDLARESPDVAACFALLRRYLFDYRADLSLPLLLLLDESGRAHKVYPEMPDSNVLKADLRLMRDPNRLKLALPFDGRYYAMPHRNHFRMGAAFFWAGYPEQALIYLNEAVQRDPQNASAHLSIGHIHMEAGRYEEARKHLKQAAALRPDLPDVWTNLGGLALAIGENTTALRYFEKALALHPDLSFALAGSGQAYARLGDAAAAERMLRRALDADPNYADAADQLGLVFARQNRLEEARDAFQRAIASDRHHVSAINNLGVLFMQMNKADDAIAAFRYGIQAAPDQELSYINLARALVIKGNRSDARAVLDQLLNRKPDSRLARKAIAELGADR
jgi:Tfp pilus assembly protein PilF